jgi:malonyl CoA-acyl carrier protein transacylase
MVDAGVTRFVECGPGEVLTAFNRLITPAADVFSLTGRDVMNEVLQLESNDGK